MSDFRRSSLTMRGTTKRHDDEQGRGEVKGPKTCCNNSILTASTVRTRSDEEIGEETKKPKLRCLTHCNIDIRNLEDKLVEDDPVFVVTGSQHPRGSHGNLGRHVYLDGRPVLHVVL